MVGTHMIRQGTAFFALLCLLPAGCGDDEGATDGANCNGAKCDDAEDASNATCAELLRDLSGLGRSTNDILGNGDPVSKLVLGAEGPCDLSVADVASTLIESGQCENHRSALVSERSQRLGQFTDYRSVTMMDCDDNQVFLHYPITAKELGADGIDAVAEHLDEVSPAIIAQDRESGVFNYYQSTGLDIRFFGNSIDLLQGTDLEKMDALDGTEATIAASLTVERNCAACHPGGGLLMKELDSPWVHWEPDFDSPQASAIVSAGKESMGRKTSGINLESTVLDGNDFVNENRVKFILDEAQAGRATVGDVLLPVLCTQEFNIGAAGFEGPDSFSFGDVVVDSSLSATFFSVDSSDVYEEILEERGSKLATAALGIPATFNETVGGFTFIHRARIDEDYQRRIADVVGRDLIDDIRAIDFTRAVYSDERCSLKGVLDQVDASVLFSGAVEGDLRKAIIETLEGANSLSPAETDFLALLQESGSSIDADAEAFDQACSSREGADSRKLLEDYMEYVGQVRKTAADGKKGLEDNNPNFIQFRFPGVLGFAMPIDDVDPNEGLRFNPQTCELTNQYVPRGGGGNPGGDDACVQLAEVVYDVEGADNGNEWIKLYNRCDDDASLEGLSLAWGGSDFGSRAELSGSIAAGRCIVVGGPTADGNNGNPDIDLPINFSPDLQNSGAEADGVAVFGAGANPIDAVVYGESNVAGLIGPDGEPRDPDVGDAPAGSSIIRNGASSWSISAAPDPSSCPDF